MSVPMKEFDGVEIPSRMVKVFSYHNINTIKDIFDFDNGEKEVFDKFGNRIYQWTDFRCVGIGILTELSKSLKKAGYEELKTIPTRKKIEVVYKDEYDRGMADERTRIFKSITELIDSDYNTKEFQLFKSDLLEWIGEE